jgi:hypothetical protein
LALEKMGEELIASVVHHRIAIFGDHTSLSINAP